jgi:triosephosphate isomerase
MRKKIVAGNWKMNKTVDEGKNLVSCILGIIAGSCELKTKYNLYVVLAPPFILLKECAEMVKLHEKISIAAQNCHSEEKGAYTGEVSAQMIKSAGADYVIIGHSERRQYFKEDNSMLFKKVGMALNNSLLPIFCCGEVLEQRNTGNHFDVVGSQLRETIFKINEDDFAKITIAYEPVWAIGTGVNATPQQAQEMHQYIRNLIKERYNERFANEASILYGGSCNAKNAKELFANPDVDGGLIGGASLIAEDFVKIINSVKI